MVKGAIPMTKIENSDFSEPTKILYSRQVSTFSKFPLTQINSQQNQQVTLDQLELLEKIGLFTKYTSDYYPTKMPEIEYFVKSQFEDLYKNFYSTGINLQSFDSQVSEEARYFGLAAYRNNIHLSEREECSVLMKWLREMKEKYLLTKLKENSKDEGIRNLQILLSFCIGESIRMSKVECNERALLLFFIWEQNTALAKLLEQRVTEIYQGKINENNKQNDKKCENYENEIERLKNELKIIEKTVKSQSETIKLKEEQLLDTSKKYNDMRIRCQAISSILDHLTSKTLEDAKSKSKIQKKLMLQTLKQLKKDRDAFRKIFPEHGQDISLDNMSDVEYFF